MRRLLLLPIVLFVVLGVELRPGEAQAQTAGNLVSFDKDEIAIETAAGERHVFEVEMASSPDQRAQGLMFRQSMDPMAGMLFIYERPEQRAMWMKNTIIPLDMLFIDEGGVIVRIQQRTVPYSLQAIYSGQPVTAVLELNAGTTSRLSIKPGDRVFHAAFQSGS